MPYHLVAIIIVPHLAHSQSDQNHNLLNENASFSVSVSEGASAFDLGLNFNVDAIENQPFGPLDTLGAMVDMPMNLDWLRLQFHTTVTSRSGIDI